MTDWTLVAAVLGAGLLLGGFLLLLLGRRGTTPAEETPSSSLRDLRAERDHLIDRLRTLELDEGDPAALATERRTLELRAAHVLRELDRLSRSRPTAPAVEAPKAPSTLRGFAWGLGSAAFLALLLVLALQFSQDRAPGAPSTGVAMGAAEVEADVDPELLALIARAEREPENAGAKLDLIQGLLARERYVDAWPFIQRLAATMPDEPRLLLYEATVREAMGQWERARELLDRAVQGDDSLTEAWVRRGLVSFELGDWAASLESWETALRQRPDGRSVLEPVIAEARKRLEAGAPPPERAPSPQAAAETEAPEESEAVKIRVELSEAARARVGEEGFLFVTARPAGVRAGPPVAAKRVPAASFPVELSLGAGDTMMGQPFPPSAFVEARLDRDGNAMTQEADDPRASADEVRPGATLRLVLE